MRSRRSFLVCALLAAGAACTGSASDPDPAPPGSAVDPSQPAPVPGGGDGGTTEGGPPGGPGADAAADAEAGPVATPYQHFDINHVLSTGQSNAVANGGKPVLDTTQPYDNLMFSSGVMPAYNCNGSGCTGYAAPTAFVPLVEGDTFFYPVETMSAPMANTITRLAHDVFASATKDPAHVVLVTLHGRSGNTYWSLRKGGSSYQQTSGYVLPFDQAMREVTDAFTLAKAAGKTYAVRAVTTIHGESDHYSYSNHTAEVPIPGTDGVSTITSYLDGLLEWQRDYESGVKAITGQTAAVPLLLSQMHNWTDTPHSQVNEWQYEAHVKSSGKVVLVTPAYVFPFATDCLHFTSDSQRWLGEYFAKAYARIVLEGLPWEPVRPKSVKVAGKVVTATYFVPKPPLVLDTQRVTNPGSYGFEYVDASGANVAIEGVAVTGPDTVSITLASAAPGGRLRYAFTAPLPSCPGPEQGVRGNLRDSDATPSLYGHDLFNWGVSFEEPAK
ncbi:MAG TPA: hypothetical protein VLT33_48175 [Labilithrix sp.]|nr:hypothetical protein [Labilithrix sp.]